MMRLVWDKSAWEDYKHWQTVDRRVLKRINNLIEGCLWESFEGIGKPEQLKYGAQGAWSRRITTDEPTRASIINADNGDAQKWASAQKQKARATILHVTRAFRFCTPYGI